MRLTKTIFIFSLLIAAANLNAQLKIEQAFPALTFIQPVEILPPADGTDRLFVVSQRGKIFVFENDPQVQSADLFLDIEFKVLSGGELGLLGLAFHPNYSQNGYFYVYYTVSNPRRTIVSKFNVSSNDPNSADINSEVILLELEQPYSNHNGGKIAFGPDGYLYISLGDGGSGGDPLNSGQDLTTLLGAILRVDVDNASGNLNYAIPPDNPFAGNNLGYKEEIYAYGLRNVWKFSFDSVSGDLWAADVGQNAWEEINIIESGKNYGWRIMEGFHCYNPSANCNQNGLTLPVWEYGHNPSGGYSITGGEVYRGTNAAELVGKYIYGDFVSGNIWALQYNQGNVINELLFETSHSIAAFGSDSKDLFFTSYAQGRIYKIVGETVSNVDERQGYNFKLEQNYPNPFNPTTRINFTIPNVETLPTSAGKRATSLPTKLVVHNMLGKEVATLLNEPKAPGIYEIEFDASNLSSGIYFYTLSNNNFRETKSMVLIK